MPYILIRHISPYKFFQKSAPQPIKIGTKLVFSTENLRFLITKTKIDRRTASEMRRKLDKIEISEAHETDTQNPVWAKLEISDSKSENHQNLSPGLKKGIPKFWLRVKIRDKKNFQFLIRGKNGVFREFDWNHGFGLGDDTLRIQLVVRGFVFDGFEIKGGNQMDQIKKERRKAWESYYERIKKKEMDGKVGGDASKAFLNEDRKIEEGVRVGGGESKKNRQEKLIEVNKEKECEGVKIGSNLPKVNVTHSWYFQKENSNSKLSNQIISQIQNSDHQHCNSYQKKNFDSVRKFFNPWNSRKQSKKSKKFGLSKYKLFQNGRIKIMRDENHLNRSKSKKSLNHLKIPKSYNKLQIIHHHSEKKPKAGKTCAICLDEINKERGVLQCKHEYCYDCIAEWTKSDNSCPLCKAKSKTLLMFRGQELTQSKTLNDRQLIIEQELNEAEQAVANADAFCYVCAQQNQQNVMLVCDCCLLRSCHIFCLDPPLHFIPEDEWYCDFCVRDRGVVSNNPTANFFRRHREMIGEIYDGGGEFDSEDDSFIDDKEIDNRSLSRDSENNNNDRDNNKSNRSNRSSRRTSSFNHHNRNSNHNRNRDIRSRRNNHDNFDNKSDSESCDSRVSSNSKDPESDLDSIRESLESVSWSQEDTPSALKNRNNMRFRNNMQIRKSRKNRKKDESDDLIQILRDSEKKKRRKRRRGLQKKRNRVQSKIKRNQIEIDDCGASESSEDSEYLIIDSPRSSHKRRQHRDFNVNKTVNYFIATDEESDCKEEHSQKINKTKSKLFSIIKYSNINHIFIF